MVFGGSQTRIFPSNPIPKVELDSFFCFVQTDPNSHLYAETSFSQYIFSSPCFRFFCRTSGNKKETGTAAVYTYTRNTQKTNAGKKITCVRAVKNSKRAQRGIYQGYINLLAKVKVRKYFKATMTGCYFLPGTNWNRGLARTQSFQPLVPQGFARTHSFQLLVAWGLASPQGTKS